MYQDTILKRIPNKSMVSSNVSYHNDIKYASYYDINPTYESMMGNIEEFLKEQEISLISPIPTKCCEESFTDYVSSTQGSCQEEALENNKKFAPNRIGIKNPYP